MAFDDELRRERPATVDPATAARLEGLFDQGRGLLARLAAALTPPGPGAKA
jgi:hypothetical protein